MRSHNVKLMQKETDPMNLRSLPPLEPPADLWPAIQAGLQQQQKRSQRVKWSAMGLAAAATVTLTLGIVFLLPQSNPPAAVSTAQSTAETAAADSQALENLIALSQQLETRNRMVRSRAGSIQANSLVYQVELEDLVAQVDDELSHQPQSLQLWSQRVNLLLDLNQLYQHQMRREYPSVASL